MDLGKRWAVETGLAYARMGQEVETPVSHSRRYAVSYEGTQDMQTTSYRSLSLANSLGDIHRNKDLPELQKNAPVYAEKQTLMVGMAQEVQTSSASLQQGLAGGRWTASADWRNGRHRSHDHQHACGHGTFPATGGTVFTARGAALLLLSE